MFSNTNILIVDDRMENLAAMEALLDDIPEINIIKAQSGNDALGLTLDYDFALILLDVQMPEMDGFETAELLRARKKTRNIPIIFVTAISKEQKHVFKGYEMGAVDYMFKPIDPNILTSKVKVFIKLYKQKQKLKQNTIELQDTISQLEKSQKNFRESEQKYRLLIENSSDAIVILQDEYLKFHNTRTQEISKYSQQELEQIPFLDHVHPDDRDIVKIKYDKRLKEKSSEVYSFRFLNKYGEEIWAEVNAIPAIWQGRPAVQGFIRDITKQRKLEDHLQQVQKMEAIGTLAGGIAHDFNNILGVIMGYTEMAVTNINEKSMVKYNMQQVLQASLRAKELVEQILTFSHKNGQNQQPVILNPIIRETLKLLRASLPKTIKIKKDIDSEILSIISNPTHIHQIIMNLCTNAAHAMEDKGGTLTVFLTSCEKSANDFDENSKFTSGPYVKLVVTDTGCGIEPHIIKKIFDPYFTTKEIGKGTGMGLAVVHSIVTKNGGYINVQSQLEKGTKFEILFPRILQNKPQKNNNTMSLPHGSQKILFIDDERLLAELGKQMLENLGYNVESSTQPLTALKNFQKKPYQYDLVITDMTMPDITGDLIAQKLIKIRPDIPVIICTGYSEKMAEKKAKTMGIKALLMKPIVMTRLATAVHNALHGSN